MGYGLVGMCGRYVSASSADEIAAHFGATVVTETIIEPNYNVAPTDPVPIVVDRAGPDRLERRVELSRWGLVQFFDKTIKVGARRINARSETVTTKAPFRQSVLTKRCIVAADSFYEWTTVADPAGGKPRKQPWCIRRVDGLPLAFAGLYAHWTDPESQDRITSCTILTRAANATIAPVHDRMPVELQADRWDQWLDPDCADPDQVQALVESIEPMPDDFLTLHAVSPAVNSVANSGPHLVDPVPALVQETLL